MPIYDTRLTFSPQANTASPAALMLRAALMSLSKRVEQDGHSHSLTSSVSSSLMWPQPEHRLELGKNWLMATTVQPPQSALYPSILTKLPQPTSAMRLLSFGLRIMFFTLRDSTQTTWFSLRKLTRPSNVERFFAFGNKELPANVFERARGEFSRLLVGLFLEGGVFSPARPKVLVGRLLMAKTLLKRDARHFAEIAKLRAFFDIGQTSVRLQVVHLVLVFVKLFRSPIKNRVVNLTNTTKRPRQQGFLLRFGVEPICVAAFDRIHDLNCMVENVRMEPLIRPVGSVVIPPRPKRRGLSRGN